MEPVNEEQMADPKAVASTRTKWKTSTLVKEDRRQQIKNNLTN